MRRGPSVQQLGQHREERRGDQEPLGRRGVKHALRTSRMGLLGAVVEDQTLPQRRSAGRRVGGQRVVVVVKHESRHGRGELLDAHGHHQRVGHARLLGLSATHTLSWPGRRAQTCCVSEYCAYISRSRSNVRWQCSASLWRSQVTRSVVQRCARRRTRQRSRSCPSSALPIPRAPQAGPCLLSTLPLHSCGDERAMGVSESVSTASSARRTAARGSLAASRWPAEAARPAARCPALRPATWRAHRLSVPRGRTPYHGAKSAVPPSVASAFSLLARATRKGASWWRQSHISSAVHSMRAGQRSPYGRSAH